MSQSCECCRRNGGHYDHLPSPQHCCTRQIDSLSSSPCCHSHPHRPIPPNYCTTHDVTPSSPGSFCYNMNYTHSPNVTHLQSNCGSPHMLSSAHHCGSCRHLPAVASPLHISRVSTSMAHTTTNTMPFHNSGFHTPTQHVHYNNSPLQPSLTPQMTTSGFHSRRQLIPQAPHNEHNHCHPRPQSPDVCTPVLDFTADCSCPTTPTSYCGMNSRRLPKPEMMLEFSPVSDTEIKPQSHVNCFEMGVNVSGEHFQSNVVPTPAPRGRSTAFVDVTSVTTNVNTMPDEQENTHFESLKQVHRQLHPSNSDTSTSDSFTHAGCVSNHVLKTNNLNTALIHPTLKETEEPIHCTDNKPPRVTPFSVHIKKVKMEGKEKPSTEVDNECDKNEGVHDVIAPPSNSKEHDVVDVNGTEGQSMEVSSHPTVPASVEEVKKPNVVTTTAVASVGSQDSQQQKEYPGNISVKTECLSQGSSDSASSNKPKKSVVLHQWFFTQLPGGSVVLHGLKDQGSANKCWRSGPIIERVSSNVLLTKSGTVYHLMGTINTKEMNKSAVWSTVTGRKVLKKFKSGFPTCWKELLQELNFDAMNTPEEKPHVVVQETPSASLKSIKSESQDTPAIDSSFLSSLKRSSRGRVIKPTLNEHCDSPFVYLYDMHGSFKGITSPVIDLTVDEDETPLPVYAEVKKEPKKNEVKESLPRKKAAKKEQLSCDSESDVSSSFGQSGRQTKRKRSRRRLVLHVTSKRKVVNITGESSESIKTVHETEQQQQHNAVVNDSLPIVDGNAKRENIRSAVASHTTGAVAKPEGENDEVDVSSQNATLPCAMITRSRKKQCVVGKTPEVEPQKLTAVKPLLNDADLNEKSVIINPEPDSVPTGKRGRRRNKRAVLVQEESDSEKEEDAVTKPKKHLSKHKPPKVSVEERKSAAVVLSKGIGKAKAENYSHKTKRNKPTFVEQTKKRPTVSWSDELVEEEHIEWTQSDIARLKRIVHNVPALTANFWEVVAQKLATGHTARECSSQYLHITAKSRKPEQTSKEKKSQVRGLTAITAKEGTIKRKRQLRNALEQMDTGYSDDIFDATPYKKKVRSVQIDLSDDDLFNDLEDDSDCDASYTPTEVRRRRVGAPSTHTPKLCDYLTTPDLKNGLKRETADNVIYKIQKAKKVQRQTTKKNTSNVERKSSKGSNSKLISLEHLHKIRSGEQTTLRLIEDSDNSSSEDSNPFSDMEEEYQNIMKQLH